jgi:GT2 family glycosyltransferase
MSSGAVPALSVIICTRNRAELLEECLASLAGEPLNDVRCEILVVDNASQDDTARVVQRLSKETPQIRYLYEDRTGLSHARNAGLQAARSEWVAYLDDDATVRPGWLQRARRTTAVGTYALIGGVYLAWYRDGKRPWFRDAYASNAATCAEYGELPPTRYAAGCVLLARRAVLNLAGGFPTELGMMGDALGYGEETRLQVELRKLQYRLGFDPDLCISHYVPLQRQSVEWMLKAAYAAGCGSWQTFDIYPAFRPVLRQCWRLLVGPLGGLAREWLSRECPKRWQNWLIAALQPSAIAAGALVSAPSARRRHRVHPRRSQG